MKYKPGFFNQAEEDYEVWHIASGPFWVLPTYLPQKASESGFTTATMNFVPLDMSLYELSRRPPGTSGVRFGPTTPDQVDKKDKYFKEALGEEYGKIGGVNLTDSRGNNSERPPWVGISDNYAGFVRSGAIKVMAGRAVSVEPSNTALKKLTIESPNGSKCLNHVSAIVMATGYSPSDSLSFLPQDILSTLEYSPEDQFIPLILDSWSTAHSEIPDLGFVGFYRGAFWGPAELQAECLAQAWAATNLEGGLLRFLSDEEQGERAAERQKAREYRDTKPSALRGQFPLGDYVGLMETLARQANRQRISMIRPVIDSDVQPVGPVIPARYPPTAPSQSHGDPAGDSSEEMVITMKALVKILNPEIYHNSAATNSTIFRALHGDWVFERVESSHGNSQEIRSSGKTTFHPRYPSHPDFQAEYLCEENCDSSESTAHSVFQLRDASRFSRTPGIFVRSGDDAHQHAASEPALALKISPGAEVMDSGQAYIPASSFDISRERQTYEFYLDRVTITSWCHLICSVRDGTRTTRYSRPSA